MELQWRSDWYVNVHGYRGGSFRLAASTSGDAPALAFGEPVAASVGSGDWRYYRVDLLWTANELGVELYYLSADVDLYVRRALPPNLSAYACRSYLGGTSPETCVIIPSGPATWYIGIHGYRAGGFTIRATAQ